MLQLVLVDGSAAGQVTACERVPFTIGRADQCDLQLTQPGVWDEHVQILRDAAGKFLVQPIGEAFLLANGERCERRILLPGDELSIGAARLIVNLAPVVQKGLRAMEAGVWAFVIFGAIGEAALLFALR